MTDENNALKEKEQTKKSKRKTTTRKNTVRKNYSKNDEKDCSNFVNGYAGMRTGSLRRRQCKEQ